MKKRIRRKDNYHSTLDSCYIICTLPFVGFYTGETYIDEKTWEKKVKLVDSLSEVVEKCSFKSRSDANKLRNYLNDNFKHLRFGVVEANLQYDYDERSDRRIYSAF